MLTKEEIIGEIQDFINQEKIYEAYQLFESKQFRFMRRYGLDETVVLFFEVFMIFLVQSDPKYEIGIAKLLWSYMRMDRNTQYVMKIVETEALIIEKVRAYEPRDEWDQFLHNIISKTHKVDYDIEHLFRECVFHFYKRFGEYSKALKHCIFGTDFREIGEFLAEYAKHKLPQSDWDLLIANYTILLLHYKFVQRAKGVFDTFIECVKEPLELEESTPYRYTLLNYSKLLIDAAIENKPEVIITIQSTYLPTIRRRDRNLARLFDVMFSECYSNRHSRGNQPSRATNILADLTSQLLNRSNNNNDSSQNQDFDLD